MSIGVMPEGWIMAKFGDVILSASNGVGGKQNKEGVGIAVSRIETIADQSINFDRVGYLAEYDPAKVEKHRLNEGDILFSHINSPTHLGKTAIFTGDKVLYHGINLLRVVVNQQVYSPDLFNYCCKLIRYQGEFSMRAQHAVNQSSLNQKKFAEFEISLVPLAEQKEIATRLDNLLAQVDSIKTCLDSIPSILKRFRQSVLAAAVSGKLTEEWRVQNEVVNTWPECRIDQLAQDERYSLGIGPFGSNLKVADYRVEGHPLVFVREIRSGGFGGEGTKYVSTKKFDELKAHRVRPGNILITKMGGPPGDVAIYPKNRPEAVITADCIKFAANESVILTSFAYYSMKSEYFRGQVLGISAGVAQQKVNLKKFRDLTLRIPSIEEQTEIVRRVEQLFTFADQIEQRVKDAQSRVNNLTQSILAKAFRGELTADWREQNPDLISGENSAEALLEKIKSEREVLESTKKAVKRKKAKV